MRHAKTVFSMAAVMSLLCLRLASDVLAAEGGQTNVTVEVLIFPGRPNPTWELQDTKSLKALKWKLEGAPEAFQQEPAGWTKLGFAVFRIHDGEALGLPGKIQVYQGIVKTGRRKVAKYRKDPAGLEQSLIDEARKQALAPAVKEAIAAYESARKGAQ